MKKMLIFSLVAVLLAIAAFFVFSSRYAISPSSPRNPLNAGQNVGNSAESLVSGVSSTVHVAGSLPGNIFSLAVGAVEQGVGALGTAEANVSAAMENGIVTAKDALANAFNGAVDSTRSTLGIPSEPAIVVPAAMSTASISNGAQSAESIAGSPNASGTVIAPLVGSVISQHDKIQFVVNGDLFKKYDATQALLAVDWDDGSQSVERLSASSGNNFLSHVYDATGTFRPIFAFTLGTTSLSYEFTVVVL